MAMITVNEYGIVMVNNHVLCKMIVDEMLSMDDKLLPCGKNGKPLRKGLFTGYNELLNAVELREERGGVTVAVYLVSRFGESIQASIDELFDRIEADFALLSLDPPLELSARIKGVLNDRLIPRNVEVQRRHA